MTIEKPVIDIDKVLDDVIKTEAAQAEARAVLAEIEARAYELLDTLQPGRVDVERWREKFGGVAENRRRRADGIRRRAGVGEASDLPNAQFIVPMIAANLAEQQRRHVINVEKEENIELYALSADELEIEAMRNQDPRVAPPDSADQIRLNSAQGKAQVQAHTEWLDAHRPDELPDSDDPLKQQGIEAARRFYGIEAPAPAAEEPAAESAGPQ